MRDQVGVNDWCLPLIMEFTLLIILVSLFGIAIGSFLNVVVFRTKTNDSMVAGRSKCRACLEPIATN